MTLGRMSDLTFDQARERLAEIRMRDGIQTNALRQTGTAGFVPIDTRDSKMTAQNRGAVAEMVVAADLSVKGYHVFRALNPGAPCDLIAMDAKAVAVRVEVKSYSDREGKVYIPRIKEQMGLFDLLAVVFSDGRIAYRRHADITNPTFPLETVEEVSTPGILSIKFHPPWTGDGKDAETQEPLS